MNKTAMQELIEWLDASIETLEKQGSFTIAAGIRAAKGQANCLLEKEKEQIINAYSKGYREGIRNEDALFDKPEDYQYYKTINNQNK